MSKKFRMEVILVKKYCELQKEVTRSLEEVRLEIRALGTSA